MYSFIHEAKNVNRIAESHTSPFLHLQMNLWNTLSLPFIPSCPNSVTASSEWTHPRPSQKHSALKTWDFRKIHWSFEYVGRQTSWNLKGWALPWAFPLRNRTIWGQLFDFSGNRLLICIIGRDDLKDPLEKTNTGIPLDFFFFFENILY